MKTKPTPSISQDLAAIMAGWNKIEAAAKAQFPNASKEELQRICACAMNHALGIRKL
jgi:hypothetical protein